MVDDNVFSALRAKQLSSHPDACFSNAPDTPASLTLISEKKIARAIKSFPAGTAGGLDVLLPQHLKDLTNESAKRCARELLRALSSFLLLILESNTLLSVQLFLF